MLYNVFGDTHRFISISEEEHDLIDQLIDKCNRANDQYVPVLTAFLDPRGQYIMEVVAGSFDDLNVTYYGGPYAEEKGWHQVTEPTEEAFEIVLIDVDYPQNCNTSTSTYFRYNYVARN